MNKYTISIGGRGCEIYGHKVNLDQREKLEHLNLNECSLDDVASILELDTFDLVSSDEIYVGAYPEHSVITVEDEDGDVVLENSIEKLQWSDLLSETYPTTEVFQKEKFYVNDNIKGRFFELQYDGGEFDLKKLELHYTIIEGIEIISKFTYDGIECEIGDYWSKGINYFLSNE